jgi:hypothetical protein
MAQKRRKMIARARLYGEKLKTYQTSLDLPADVNASLVAMVGGFLGAGSPSGTISAAQL